MGVSLISLKILTQAIGSILIITGFYLIVKIHPFSSIHNYDYISEKERRRHSIKASIGATISILGIVSVFMAGNSQKTTLNFIFSILEISLCLSPAIALMTFLKIYRDLQTFTKSKDDIVSTDKNKIN